MLTVYSSCTEKKFEKHFSRFMKCAERKEQMDVKWASGMWTALGTGAPLL